MTRAEAARRAGCSVRHLEDLAREGDGPVMVRLGSRVTYPVAEFDQWLRSKRVKSTSEATVREAAA
ncbi:MAG: helix-turn-helix domain-containing protein [Rhodospirillales bacterium]